MCFLILDKLKRCWQCFRPNGLSKLLVTPNKVTTQWMNYKQVSSTVDIFRHCSELLQKKDATLHLTLPAEYEAFDDKVASHPPSKKKLCGNAHQDTFWQRSLFSISALTWACVDELVISKASSGLRPFHCSYPGNWMLRPCHRNKATWLFIFICFSILMVICLRKIVICVVNL